MPVPNPLLSIVIPTYNRAEFLDHCLEIHIPLARQCDIQIYVFDNASTDETKAVVGKWQNNYPHISYQCSEANLGADANFERALGYPDTDYVWLLGDTYHLPTNGIEHILALAANQQTYDAIIFNLEDLVKIDETKARDYTDQNALLADLGALMTCLSCLVFHRRLIQQANCSRYRNSNFIQVGMIFETIATRPFRVRWVQFLSVQGLRHPRRIKKGWYQTDEVFEIACRRWTNFVFSLPVSYSPEAKLKCLMDFGDVSRIFQIQGIVRLRIANILNRKSYKTYSLFYPFTIRYPKSVIFAICVTPRPIVKCAAILVILIYKHDKAQKIKQIVRNEA